ncbi:MAG: polysaccharide biosynthesis protein VpsQ [Chthoniobacter sp.]|jgi:VanZ family protein|nr:polysaccharide biosynthesis protein VpsQ [Chthoniobacter sp.]
MNRWLPTLLWLALVVVIIYLADRHLAPSVFGWIDRHLASDKLGHFVLIGGLAGMLNFSLRCRRWRGWLVGSLIVAALCSLEELSQAFIPVRHCDWGDLAADFLGILVFGWIARRFCAVGAEV